MQLQDLTLHFLPCRTRLPFRFGKVVMEEAPMLIARVAVRTGTGGEGVGVAADLLVPKWFDKNSATSVEEDRAALVESARAAGEAWTAMPAELALFEQWDRVRRILVDGAESSAPKLVRLFGLALVERAVMDAFCRAEEISFFEAWLTNRFGFAPERCHPTLRHWNFRQALSRGALKRIRVRHTVGMLDALRASEVPSDLRGDDGHPCSLEEDIRAYGLTAFKLKVGGDPSRDLERLDEVGRLLVLAAPGAVVTLDGNEQYGDLGQLVSVLERLRGRPGGAAILGGLAHIEQPSPRAMTFEGVERVALARLAAFAPLIIDEADADLDAFPRALALGYRGVSVKNCKSVFRAVLHRGLAELHGPDAFLAGEDLTNLPVWALQQDLATAALLRLPHVERNGHHYFRGLDHLPRELQTRALNLHPDLYQPASHGASLRIESGTLSVESLHCVGYGYAADLAWPP